MESLPLDDAWPEIAARLGSHRNFVLVAEPGAGKTTRFPPRLIDSPLVPPGSRVLILEPRRLAARAAAARIADERKWKLGAEVGYRVRFDTKVSASTRLEFLTEGLLSRRLQADPELEGVSAVVLDEFHERSQHTDLAIGLLLELQQLSRPDLRLIVMSATLDADAVSKFLGHAPIVRVPGRTHPVTTHHASHPLIMETGPRFLDAAAAYALDVCEGRLPSEGDVLMFLPGAREIRGVAERIGSRVSSLGFDCVELHGSLALEDQDRAIRRAEAGRKKIVLATNIAESSLTIDGVGTVIDTGLARVVRFDSAGFSRLQLSRISLASATQRAGRAGRQGPGHCHRFWNKLDEASMPPFEVAEILRTDLSDPLLLLLGFGVSDPSSFSWFEKPSVLALRSALETLDELGFREPKTGALTSRGHEALKLPLSVRPARLLLEAAVAKRVKLGSKLAALLSEKDILLRSNARAGGSHAESDVLVRLNALDSGGDRVDRNAKQSVNRVVTQLEEAAKKIDLAKLGRGALDLSGLDDDEAALRLLLLGFPDRLARRRKPGQPAARMIGGRGVQLANFSTVERAEFFVCLDSMETPPIPGATRSDPTISLASRVELSWIESAFAPFIADSSRTRFDDESESMVLELARSFHDLPLGEPKVGRPAPDEAHESLVEACLDRWASHFQTHEEITPLLGRIAFLHANGVEAAEVNDEAKRAFLDEACFGELKLSNVLAKPLGGILLRHLGDELSRALSSEAPTRIKVPSGSELEIHYPPDRSPFLEVRIQEIFGWTESPKIARGRVAIQLHLLGPNFRPVQVTSDLASFWKTGYVEVRKELRARYPKHSWPEDPFTAKPEAKGRPRR
ncbi:MAG: ATP-dependent helicase HrpB [Bdellovibrionota bacterium]